MKLGLSSIAPFLLLAGRFGLSSATGLRKLDQSATPIGDTAAFIAALEGATTDPEDPTLSLMRFFVGAPINFDTVEPRGLDLGDKYFHAICDDYDDSNKCKFERTSTLGRFFFGVNPLMVSFEGFDFIGGSAQGNEHRDGGAFAFETHTGTSHVAFDKCAFVDNAAEGKGGAFYISAKGETSHASLEFNECAFESNAAYDGGGSIYAGSYNGTADLNIEDSVFTTDTYGSTNDIKGELLEEEGGSEDGDGSVSLSCNRTTTTGGKGSVDMPHGETCDLGDWDKITHDDFEDNLGTFKKRQYANGKAVRFKASNADDPKSEKIPNGLAAVRLRQDGPKASIWHKRTHDVSNYTKLVVSFWFYTFGMEQGKTFEVQYKSAGESWIALKHYESGVDFENEKVYKVCFVFQDENAETNEGKIRFKTNGGRKSDQVFIDEVWFEGLSDGL